MLCKCVLTTGMLHVTGIGMLHVSRTKVERSVVHKIIFSVTRVNSHLSSNQLIFMERTETF